MNMDGVRRIVNKATEELQDTNNSPLLQELWRNEHPNKEDRPIDKDGNKDKEYTSWENSLPILLDRIKRAGLGDLDIFFEYPSIATYGRIDALLVGYNHDKKPCIVLFELKQWNKICPELASTKSEVFIPETTEEKTPRNHPLYQLLEYESDFSVNTATAEKDIEIHRVAFLHNFSEPNELVEGNYYKYWAKYQNEIYGKNDYQKLEEFLRDTLLPQRNSEFADQLAKATYKLTPASFKDLKKALKGEKFATMVNEQSDIERRVVQKIRKLKDNPSDDSKQMIVIQGAPGTGKTIIGLQLLCDYVKVFHNSNCVFCLPRSKTVHAVIEKETDFKVPYTNTLPSSNKMLIVDEAHRITDIKKELDNLYRKTNFLILLQDDRQRIQPDEKGTLDNFIKYANEHGIHHDFYELKLQKRSGFLDNYVNNIDRLFYGDKADSFENNDFKIGIFSDPETMLEHLKENAETHSNNRNKLIASFDWSWNHKSDDVTIKGKKENGESFCFQKPWNPIKSKDQADWYLAQGPDSVKSGEIDKIGCIYTVQGLEFDNVGFIWGKDFVWDKDSNKWKINLDELQDKTTRNQMIHNTNPEDNLNIMKNIYRVLLTRATQGLGIYFLDKDTKEHVKQFFNIEE